MAKNKKSAKKAAEKVETIVENVVEQVSIESVEEKEVAPVTSVTPPDPKEELKNAKILLAKMEEDAEKYTMDDCKSLKTLVSTDSFATAFAKIEADADKGRHTVWSFIQAVKSALNAKPKKAKLPTPTCEWEGIEVPEPVDCNICEHDTLYIAQYYLSWNKEGMSQLMKYLRGEISKFDLLTAPNAWDNSVEYDEELIVKNASYELASTINTLCVYTGLMSPAAIAVDPTISEGDVLIVSTAKGLVRYDVLKVDKEGIHIFNESLTPKGREYDILEKFDGYFVLNEEDLKLKSNDPDVQTKYDLLEEQYANITSIQESSVDLADHKRGYLTYVLFNGASVADGVESGDCITLVGKCKSYLTRWLRLVKDHTLVNVKEVAKTAPVTETEVEVAI